MPTRFGNILSWIPTEDSYAMSMSLSLQSSDQRAFVSLFSFVYQQLSPWSPNRHKHLTKYSQQFFLHTHTYMFFTHVQLEHTLFKAAVSIRPLSARSVNNWAQSLLGQPWNGSFHLPSKDQQSLSVLKLETSRCPGMWPKSYLLWSSLSWCYFIAGVANAAQFILLVL